LLIQAMRREAPANTAATKDHGHTGNNIIVR
jgi:hypothetical protein